MFLKKTNEGGGGKGFPCCSTREDLSIDVSIIYYCRTDIDEARVISAQVKIQFRTFLKK